MRPMPHFIVERTLNTEGVTEEQWRLGMKQMAELAAAMPHVKWLKSYHSHSQGKVYCEYEAPTPEDVMEHSRRAGLPWDRVSQIERVIDTSMFE